MQRKDARSAAPTVQAVIPYLTTAQPARVVSMFHQPHVYHAQPTVYNATQQTIVLTAR